MSTGLRRIKSIYGDACARCRQAQCPAWCSGSAVGIVKARIALRALDEEDKPRERRCGGASKLDERLADPVVEQAKRESAAVPVFDSDGKSVERVPAGWAQDPKYTDGPRLCLDGQEWGRRVVKRRDGKWNWFRDESFRSGGQCDNIYAAMLCALGCAVTESETSISVVDPNGIVWGCWKSDSDTLRLQVERLTADREHR